LPSSPSSGRRLTLAVVNPSGTDQTMSVEVDGLSGFNFTVPPGAATLVWDA
jgi:hypothetical protein